MNTFSKITKQLTTMGLLLSFLLSGCAVIHPGEVGIKQRLGKLDLEIADLGLEGSRFFKTVYKNPARLGAMVRETEVVDSLEG